MTEEKAVEEQSVVPGTEGTEYEGMSEEDIERAEFDKAVAEDPELSGEAEPESEPEPESDPEPPEPENEEKEGDDAGEPKKPAEEEPEKPTGPAWLESLPEEEQAIARQFIDGIEQDRDRLNKRVKSHLGQLRPAQRTIAKLQTHSKRLQAQLDEQQQANPTFDTDARVKAYNDWVDEEYKEFPEEAAKLKTRFAESLDGLPEVLPNTPTQPAPEASATFDPKEEVANLEVAYSDWGERRFSPEFDEWFQSQSPETQALLNSPLASDNIILLDAFTEAHPDWVAPQGPDEFHSLAQALHSPLFRGWAEGEGVNLNTDWSSVPDYQRDRLLTRFKSDLGTVLEEEQAEANKAAKLQSRRSRQLQDRDPGSRRAGVKPGPKIDLNTEEGQRAYYKQLVDSDPDLQ